MKKIVICGAGGFGREVQWLIERINSKSDQWDIEGYIDDNLVPGMILNGLPVLGGVECLNNYEESLCIVCAVGNAQIRKKLIDRIKQINKFQFPNLIDPTVEISRYVSLGEGNIICAGNILTVNIQIGNFVILNLYCTVGHDAVLNSYATVYPGVNISGMASIGTLVELGTGGQVLQGIKIGDGTIVGAGAVVTKDLPSQCTAVGMPARPVKWGVPPKPSYQTFQQEEDNGE